ncbi:formyltetrahydrofolate deformylase [Arthrobacter caoxuetaonis]|uniref:Formyltetrahydrofolate deformylase n=1 Tax=Arthrobacter caoxuetaonis TaxID=2886935 RepID=A0A9X1MCG7_9MICC|nr:formyltetrahydrofolate deformylase [Arthrobacter caoxuetaonis]MCC3297459.1 formyltetrahydrofolate deformylase [Arthrobacter caoxuetaonis]USQ58009.1 formyltetrahydrofolate deformylase [Arthrobacter caoxuetaonis]
METSTANLPQRPPAADPGQDNVARLVLKGTDQSGIVAATTDELARFGANIVSLDQHTSDPAGGRFFQRTVFTLPNLSAVIEDLRGALGTRLANFGLEWELIEARKQKRVAVFVSKSDHCLLDLLWRQRRGELPVNITMVVSNHPDLSEDVRAFGIPYFYIPADRSRRTEAEARELELVQGNVDLIVLARYMQIITEDFIEQAGVPIINIHHSFLPAFIGAGPYRKAKERGVKLIGATAHYVTKDLDEGPIITQDVINVSHRESVTDLQRRGADVERRVLSTAVEAHCEDRVIRDGNVTIVF